LRERFFKAAIAAGAAAKVRPSHTEGSHMSQTIRRVELKDRVIILAGTVHISQESALEVRSLIETEKPGRVCVEIDEGRYRSMSQDKGWESLDIGKVLKEGKGFLLMATWPGRFPAPDGRERGRQARRRDARRGKGSRGRRHSLLVLRPEVQVTLKRAWSKSGLWNKAKLLASLVESAFSNEKLSEEEIEKLKEKNELDSMMSELASFLLRSRKC